jgi:hypothetical protein
VWFAIRSSTDVCVWLWTPFGLKTKFLSGKLREEYVEFIPWMVKTVDRRD